MFDGKAFTRILPVAMLEGGAWKVYSGWDVVLPDDGKVFWWHPPGIIKGDLFTFSVEKNPRPDPDLVTQDRYIPANPQSAVELLDFRNVETELARRAIVEIGLEGLLRGADRIVVALENRTCAIVSLELHPATSRRVAALSSLEALPLYQCDQTLFEGDRIDGRYIVIPAVTVGQRVGVLNWSRDSDFFETVLRRLRKTSSAVTSRSAESFQITRAQIAYLVSLLSRADLLPSTGEDLAPMKARLAAFSQTIKLNVEAIPELIDLICELTPVKECLDAELSERRDGLELQVRIDLEKRVRKELEDELHTLTAEREHLILERAKLEAAVENGRHTLSDIQAAISKLHDCLDRELVSLQNRLADLPASGLESARALSTLIAAQLKGAGRVIELVPGQVSPWARAIDSSIPNFTDWTDFAEALQKAAKRSSIHPDTLRLVDIVARAGSLVVLPASSATAVVQCYASVVAGDEVLRHALDPSVIGLDDIWRQPVSSIPTAFARAWVAAQSDSRSYKVVLLDGLERTPMDVWLPSFFEVLNSHDRPSNLAVFGSLGDRMLDPARAWLGLAKFATALSPQITVKIDAELTALAMGRSISASKFDAQAVPLPSQGDLADVLDIVGQISERWLMVRALRSFRAGWPHRGQIDLMSLIKIYCTGLEGRLPDNAHFDSVIQGRSWILSVLDQSSARKEGRVGDA